MFNSLPPDRLVAILATVLRESAGWDRPLEPFQTGQLKSASSIGRFAAAEIAHGGAAFQRFAGAVRAHLPDAPDDVAPLGEFLCERLAHADDERRAAIHGLLRDLTNAEIDILLGATKGVTT